MTDQCNCSPCNCSPCNCNPCNCNSCNCQPCECGTACECAQVRTQVSQAAEGDS